MNLNFWMPDKFPKRAKKLGEFVQLMANRLSVGSFRYQDGSDEFGTIKQDYLKRLKGVIKEFEKTGNTEKLIDGANYCALLFYNSLHPDTHFKSEDQGRTHTSP